MRGTAAVFAPLGREGSTLTRVRIGRRTFAEQVGLVPVLFDPSVPFQLTVTDASGPLMLAYLHQATHEASAKMVGRLRSMGCVLDVVRADVSVR